jgi:hypothetical protein
MLLSTYNPNSQGTCPKCGFVACRSVGGNLAFGSRYMDLQHDACGTRWRVFIDEGRVEVLQDAKA